MKKLFSDVTAAQRELAAIRAAQRGDPAGFQLLYEKHKSYVYSLCLRMTHDAALSEDLTQDVFLHIWKKVGSFKGNAMFRTWLYRVAINTVLLYFRRHKAIDLSLDNELVPSTELKMMDSMPQPDLEASFSLQQTLGSLSPRYRCVLMLHDVHGYRHQDISHLLGITSGASRSQLHKARVKIRLALGKITPRKKTAQLHFSVA
jgi:RNA polymerase sigma-70 factor, ECF subfamily